MGKLQDIETIKDMVLVNSQTSREVWVTITRFTRNSKKIYISTKGRKDIHVHQRNSHDAVVNDLGLLVAQLRLDIRRYATQTGKS